ncbi:hypothetical protein V1511DRAFT_489695 [Dipodascopsis uninucleata]
MPQQHSPDPTSKHDHRTHIRPVVPLQIPSGPKTALGNNASISASQVHRRASAPDYWSPITCSPPSFSTMFYGGGPRRASIPSTAYNEDNQMRRQFLFGNNNNNNKSISENNSLSSQPSSDRSSMSSEASGLSKPDADYVVCQHHHHRRPSVALRFSPNGPPENLSPSSIDSMDQVESQVLTPTKRKFSNHFERPPTPTGERLLKGEVAF